MDQEFWDRRYRDSERVWSGRVNGALRAEVDGMTPGRALDLGCGEGADAIWLAERGWRVTAIDISPVALERAAAAAGADSGIDWRHVDPRESAPAKHGFDLVSALYFPVLREAEHTTMRGLVEAVAPGGTLLVVGHALHGPPPSDWDGPDPREYYQPSEVAELLGEDWLIEVNEARVRPDVPADNPHHEDTVLRARRTP